MFDRVLNMPLYIELEISLEKNEERILGMISTTAEKQRRRAHRP